MNREKLSRAIMHANVTTDEEVTAKIVAAVVAEFAEELAVVEAAFEERKWQNEPWETVNKYDRTRDAMDSLGRALDALLRRDAVAG